MLTLKEAQTMITQNEKCDEARISKLRAIDPDYCSDDALIEIVVKLRTYDNTRKSMALHAAEKETLELCQKTLAMRGLPTNWANTDLGYLSQDTIDLLKVKE